MKQLIENIGQQLTAAIAIGKKGKLSFKTQNFNQVLVSGLGGSGIGASIVQEYVYDKLSIPFVVNKDYSIPKSVQASTLFIACSYSGNTEETLYAAKAALKSKATIVCVTSGGSLAEFAKKHSLQLILIPSGMPPRACLGYSLVQLLYILHYAKLINKNFESALASAINIIQKETKAIQKKASELAKQLVNKQIAIYITAGKEGLGVRFRQQLNENSKVLSWSSVIPEMTHNEIVGWRAANSDVAVVLCYHKNDFNRNLKRLNILKKVVKQYNSNVSEIVIKGDNYWDQAFYFIHLTDWVSFYLSALNGNDAVEVKVIDYLKKEMAKK